MYAAALWLGHLGPVDVVVLCPDEVARINSCADLAQIKTRLRKSVATGKISELFD
jgi:hypothetical protein